MTDDDLIAQGKVAAQHWAATAGARMLDDVRAMLVRYVAFPSEHAAVASALWILHTWVVGAFFTTPRLVAESPEPGSGKTRLLELFALLCRDGRLLVNASPAALYRRISASEQPPTILQDESDAIFGRNATSDAEALRAIYNAGYKKGATVDRCEGDGAKMKVVAFRVFAPVALAGLGAPPRTIATRAVTISMRKRATGETVAPFRERDAISEAAPIRAALEKWADSVIGDLESARPHMPEGVVDRAAEVWEPLLAVAESVGGTKWPELARAACKHFVLAASDEASSLGVRLLAELHRLYNPTELNPVTEMHSAAIVAKLTEDEDSPWRDLWGKPLDQRRLAAELRKYGVRPKQIRIGEKSSKGYQTDPHGGPDGDSLGLDDAWQRYLPQNDRNIRNKGNNAAQGVSDDPSVSDASETKNLTETQSDLLTSTVSDVSDVSANQGAEPLSPAVMPPRRPSAKQSASPERRRTIRGKPADLYPACIICSKPVVAGQGDTHLSCSKQGEERAS